LRLGPGSLAEPGPADHRLITNGRPCAGDDAAMACTTRRQFMGARRAAPRCRCYQEWDNFTDNAVEYFLPFKRIGNKLLAFVETHYRTTEEFYFALFEKSPADQQRLLSQLAQGRASLTPAERRLFDRGMARSEPESLMSRLKADIAAGRLPKVSWLVPSAVDSDGTPIAAGTTSRSPPRRTHPSAGG
jgi:phospholipase C